MSNPTELPDLDRENLESWPERIWLQAGDADEREEYETVRQLGDGITWADNQIDRFDVEYVRADLARRAKPEGEAPLVEGDAIARSKRILHLVDEYVEQQTAGRRTALRCALMDQFSRDITPHQLLEVARATGLRQFLHGVNATDARQLLADFVAAVPAAACGVQQAAAPGAQLVIGVAAPQGATISIMQPHADGTTTVIYGGTHPAGDSIGRAVVAAAPANSPEIPDGSLTDEGTSAPGTPEAPSGYAIVPIEPTERMIYEGGIGRRDQMVDAADVWRQMLRAAQLDGGQEGSES